MVDTCRGLLESGRRRSISPPTSPRSVPAGKIGDPEAGGEVRQMGVEIPDGWMGLDIGPGHRGRVRRRHRRGPHHPLERADGRVRGSPVRGRHPHRGRGGGRRPGIHAWSVAATAPPRPSSSASTIDIDHVSTGGGASLELLEQGDLPRACELSTADRLRSRPHHDAMTRHRWPSRKPLISGNWKMHHNHFEAIQMVQKLALPI